jgi:hypothetical protein
MIILLKIPYVFTDFIVKSADHDQTTQMGTVQSWSALHFDHGLYWLHIYLAFVYITFHNDIDF